MTGSGAEDAAQGAEALTASEYLEHQLKERGLDQLQLAELTGVSRQTINAIVRGRQPISRAMSAKLGRLFGQPPDFWLREQFRRASQRISEAAVPADMTSDAADSERPAESVAPRSRTLTDHEIRRAVDDGTISVEPFTAAHVNAASLDLCLGRVDALGAKSGTQASGSIAIAPLECAHAWSRETCACPPI